MKKLVLASLVFALSVGLVACGDKAEKKTDEVKDKVENKDDNTIKVAAQLETMIDILNFANEQAEKDGYKIEVMKVADNMQYNELVQNKEADANFAQHEPFMKKFNEEKNGDLVAVQPIYDAKVGFYSKDYKKIDEVPNGAKIAIPSDIANEGRALAILNDYDLIKLKDGVGFNGTTKDIVENPHDFEFMSVDLLNLSEAYNEPDVALVYNYPAYITKVGLTPNDAVILERKVDDRFAIQIVAREDNKDSEKIKALVKAMTTDEMREYLIDNFGETLIPSF